MSNYVFQNVNWRTGRDEISIRYLFNLIMFKFNFISYKKFRPKKKSLKKKCINKNDDKQSFKTFQLPREILSVQIF